MPGPLPASGLGAAGFAVTTGSGPGSARGAESLVLARAKRVAGVTMAIPWWGRSVLQWTTQVSIAPWAASMLAKPLPVRPSALSVLWNRSTLPVVVGE